MTKRMNTEIIAVGTELLLGQITNTNATWLSEQLANHGINTFYHTVVGDNLGRLSQVFAQAQSRSDVVIVTGGLGPTVDDLSREAFQELSDLPLEEDEASIRKIESFFARKQTVMTENNRRQARVFPHSIVLDNKVGMAPGNIVHLDGVTWIFLPGVPREMKQLVTDGVIPYLKERNGEQLIQSKVLRFIGIGESVLEDRLVDLIQSQENPTIAPLVEKDGVTIRISAKAESKKTAEKLIAKTETAILDRVGAFYYGDDNTTLASEILRRLQEKRLTISSAESVTGGLFSDKLISVTGASQVFRGGIVCYDEAVKQQVVGVSSETLDKFGTVSEACASELATNIRSVIDSDIGISFTGVAGPNKENGQEVGTVYIGLSDKAGYHHVEQCHFQGDRNQIRYRSVLKGLELLFRYMER